MAQRKQNSRIPVDPHSLRFSKSEALVVHLSAIYQLTQTRESRELGKKMWVGRAESKDCAFRLASAWDSNGGD